MKRRDLLKASITALGLSAFPAGWVSAEESKPQRVLFFTRNLGYYHGVVKRSGDALSFAEQAMVDFCKAKGIEVVCVKDGRVFDEDLDQYDAVAFYCNNNLTEPGPKDEPPMTIEGKQRLLDAINGGKGFLGFHSTCACWRTSGPAGEDLENVDPFLAMLGGEFASHGPQQEAPLKIVDGKFPGMAELALGEQVAITDEWYAMKNFARDMHVIMVQQTTGMKGGCYDRPDYPSIWARNQGKGRVYFNSMGHREDVWTNPTFQAFVLGGLAWAMGNVCYELKPNLESVTPDAEKMKR